MSTEKPKHPGGRPVGYWRTQAGRRTVALFYITSNDNERMEALWGSAMRILLDGGRSATVLSRLVGVSRRTWARWTARVEEKAYPIVDPATMLPKAEVEPPIGVSDRG